MISNKRLQKIREYCAKASPGPWTYNSYSAIHSTPMDEKEHDRAWEEYAAAGEPKGPGDKPADPWRRRLYDVDTRVASVPAIAGDTASGRHACDAVFIEQSRTDLPALVDELEKCRKAPKFITEISFDLEYYGPGESPAQAMRKIAYEALPSELEGT